MSKERENMAHGRYGIDSVHRGLELLQAIAERGHLSLCDAMDITGSAKSTAFRLLQTLQDSGLIEQDPLGGYRPGPESVRWGMLLLGRLDVSQVAAEELRQLWLETGETVGLAILTARSIVLTEILESPSPFRMAEVLGTVIAPHSSALGKAILAYLEPSYVDKLLGSHSLEMVTDHSPGTRTELERRLERVRSEGFSVDIEESALGVACVAAPIFKLGSVMGGISIAGPRVRMTDERIERLGCRAAIVAARISGRLSPKVNLGD